MSLKSPQHDNMNMLYFSAENPRRLQIVYRYITATGVLKFCVTLLGLTNPKEPGEHISSCNMFQHSFSPYHKNARIPIYFQQNVFDRPTCNLERLKRVLINYMRFEILKVVKILMLVSWVVTPCEFSCRHHIGGTYCLHLRD
jgi:hypothetical protein